MKAMSAEAAITFAHADASAKPRSVVVQRGSSILEAAFQAQVEIAATCGARGRCRSCRVKVLNGELPPPTVQDIVQLGGEALQERFRLACQTKVIGDCTVVPMAPHSESGHQILAGGHAADDDRIELESGVRKTFVVATAPREEHHQTSDLEEICTALGFEVDREVPLDVLRQLPTALRSESGRLTVTTFNKRIINVEAGDTTESCYGMAFDIGTTSIVGALLDLRTGQQLAEVGGINPQAVHGGDLMSRIAFAQFNEKKLQTLRAKVLGALNNFIREACSTGGVAPEQIYKIVIVGNTCMHHVLLGIDVSYLGLAPYAPVVRDLLVYPAAALPLKGAPNAQICLLPIVAGFVGADTMACVLATRIYENDEIQALVDIGTNGEVVMGSKGRLMACSAPAGPAFEGAQIRDGMRGAVGAIDRVTINGDVVCGTIGDVPPIGVCGSGLIDACAKMIDAGVIKASGALSRETEKGLTEALRARLLSSPNGREFVLAWREQSGKDEQISLTQADIRQLQLAKSAIYSGIVMLQRVMGIPLDAIEKLMLCGGFGNYISIDSAVKIRLLPEIATQRITYVGNAAALGAQMALLSERERLRAFELAGRIEHVALATRPEFQEIFVDGMTFGSPGATPEEVKAPETTLIDCLDVA
jgi:uncharacterized 2Fe-2S/4Fe-4S cluster protein (DUF4445 family)